MMIFEQDILIFFCRFICAIILHLSLSEETATGLNKMKYAVNHYYKFQNYKQAYFVGLMQFTQVQFVEIVNIFQIMSSAGAAGCVANFVSFAIIADIDNYLYDSWTTPEKNIMDEDLLSDLFMINHTTSKRCDPDELVEIEEREDPIFLKI